jgi:hypothetical protein
MVTTGPDGFGEGDAAAWLPAVPADPVLAAGRVVPDAYAPPALVAVPAVQAVTAAVSAAAVASAETTRIALMPTLYELDG